MSDARWDRVKDLVYEALQLAPEQRERFLDEASASDAALRAEIESLLSAGAQVQSDFLNSSRSLACTNPAAAGLTIGQIFAERYRLIRRLGEGGMGQVWLAEQTEPVQRLVAVKLIKAGMYDESVVQRFHAERQSLAIMDHPAIAKVFDAGATPQGQPFFVMEYVPGAAIHEYCDQRRLGIRARLALFIQACEGVQHAHQKAIIHRDLKPANILVAEIDGAPLPRIIDFGLARLSTATAEENTRLTRLGDFFGTPGYVSPEQVDPAIQDVDTRTDVYSLGVILYVLLTGLQPFEAVRRQQIPPDELLRRLREDEPLSPSAKVSGSGVTAFAAAEARDLQPKQLVKLLRGDLDWITMKALERQRERRYGTPAEFAADLRRFLNHEPVLARPAGALYRLRRYARRHRVAVGAASALLLLFAAFSVLQAVQLQHITHERDRANRERDRAARITDFMTGMFQLADPSEARGNTVSAREILDKASKDITTGLAQDPEVQSRLLEVMAHTYVNLGLYSHAHVLAESALEARRRRNGPDDPATLESMTQLGWILDREGKTEQARKLETQALMDERRVLGPADPLTVETTDHLAVILQSTGDYAQAERLARKVIEVDARQLGPDDPKTLHAMQTLGNALWFEGRYADAERTQRRLLDTEQRLWGDDHPDTLRTMSNLALTLQSQGQFAKAIQLYRDAVAAAQRVLGPEHRDTADAKANLATLLIDEGHLADGETLDREVLAIRARALGVEHSDTLLAKLNLADVLLREGHVGEAESLQRETLEVQLRIIGADHPNTLLSKSDLARSLLREGRFAEAEKTAREAFERQLPRLGPQHPDVLATLEVLGMALSNTRRYREADQLFRSVIQQQSAAAPQGDSWPVWYAFAHVAMAAHHSRDAMDHLQQALDHGFGDGEGLLAEEAFKPLRTATQFQQLVARLGRQTAGASAP